MSKDVLTEVEVQMYRLAGIDTPEVNNQPGAKNKKVLSESSTEDDTEATRQMYLRAGIKK